MNATTEYLQMEYVSAQDVSEDGRREHVFVASDGSISRSRRRLNPAGWDLTSFERNPIVLENHKTDEMPIGTAKVWQEPGKLMAGITFARTARAQEIEQLVDQKIVRAVSVGWITRPEDIEFERDGGKIIALSFNKQTLIEISVVSVPDNPNALKVASFGYEQYEELFVALSNERLKFTGGTH